MVAKLLSISVLAFSMISLSACDMDSILNDNPSQNTPVEVIEFLTTVTINGETKQVVVNRENPLSLDDYVPKVKDMNFEGWYLDEAYTIPCEIKTINIENQILNVYGKLVPKQNLTLSLAINGEIKEHVIVRGTTVDLSTYTEEIEGYIFDAWYLDAEYTQKITNTLVKINSSTTYYAKYNALEAFTINIFLHGFKTEVKVNEWTAINLSNYITPTDSQVLEGWYYDEEFTRKADNRLVVRSDLTLYINCYDKVDTTYTIYGLEDIIVNATYVGAEINLNAIDTTKENFVFNGWYLDEAYTQKIDNPQYVKIIENLKIYAKYTENPKSQISIIVPTTNGEYEELSLGIHYLDKTINLKDYTLSSNQNINFEGLYKEDSFENKIDLKTYNVGELVGNSLDFKIYAKYTATLNIYMNDDLILTDEIIYGGTILPEDYINPGGENYRYEGIDRTDEILMDNKAEIKLNGYSYIDYELYDNYEYEVVEGGISITSYTGNNAILVIPSTINNKAVVKIAGNALPSTLVSITIPETVTTIDSKAFYNCTKMIEIYNLSSVSLNSKTLGVDNIYTTLSSPSKISIYKDEYVVYKKDTKNYVVAYLGKKPTLTLPSNINGEEYEIYKHAFAGNDYLNTIVIPEGLKVINEYAFSECYNLIRVRIPSTIESIGILAFSSCFNLIEIYNDSNLTIVKDTPEFGAIGQYALKVYPKGTSFTDDFQLNFEKVTFEKETYDVAYLTYNINGVINLLGISKADGDYNFVVLPSAIDNSSYEIYHHAFYGVDYIQSIIIPDSVHVIGDSAFENCYALKEVNLNNVTEIGAYAFANCYRLSKIEIPSSVNSIGSHAFYKCTNAIGITINEGVETIGDQAFANCTSITEITVPNSVTLMGEKVFLNCSRLAKLTLPFVGRTRTDTRYYYFGYIFGGITTDSGTINLNVPSSLKTVHITDDEELENQAFWSCTSIQEMIFTNTTTLKTSTFGCCSGLKTISFSSDVLFEDIKSDSFYQCNVSTFRTDHIVKFIDSLTMTSIFTSKATLKTYSDAVEGSFTLKQISASTSDIYDLDSLVGDFQIVLTNGMILDKHIFDLLTEFEESKSTQSTKYSVTSNISTYTLNNVKYYKEGTYQVGITVMINGTTCTYYSEVDFVVISNNGI